MATINELSNSFIIDLRHGSAETRKLLEATDVLDEALLKDLCVLWSADTLVVRDYSIEFTTRLFGESNTSQDGLFPLCRLATTA